MYLRDYVYSGTEYIGVAKMNIRKFNQTVLMLKTTK